jgi:hypothetical protein
MRRPESAGAEVERLKWVIEVDVQPLAAGCGGMLGGERD